MLGAWESYFYFFIFNFISEIKHNSLMLAVELVVVSSCMFIILELDYVK